MQRRSFPRRNNRPIRSLSLALLASLGISDSAYTQETHRHGETRANAEHELMVWDDGLSRWVSPEIFWQRFAAQRDSRWLGRRPDYPPYREARERDLLMIELPQGVCLMEFWHRRWRRAQDVRRWSAALNEYGGCPHVFDN